ncbi:hypothetical protein GCM10025771_00050 [Niveibacterium umoris]|uniref:STAS/SEC14 domain-containing protein n=1 Tax=Niveibacterium umoris TaxID=1193620 RepID=A0A840BQG7_9RHOO|nr:STAS/SEC14 domain-containing protein [Niveibacterium umoris]MBB4014934.1 hypothetical protein [Niveibacterium umoris]
MITAELRDNCVEAVVFGELTLADFRQFEAQIEAAIGAGKPLRAFVDLREMAGLTLDAVIEDYRFARRHKNDDGRIAVLTNSDLDSIGAWLEQSLVSADIRLFDDEGMARAWLAGESVA